MLQPLISHTAHPRLGTTVVDFADDVLQAPVPAVDGKKGALVLPLKDEIIKSPSEWAVLSSDNDDDNGDDS